MYYVPTTRQHTNDHNLASVRSTTKDIIATQKDRVILKWPQQRNFKFFSQKKRVDGGAIFVLGLDFGLSLFFCTQSFTEYLRQQEREQYKSYFVALACVHTDIPSIEFCPATRKSWKIEKQHRFDREKFDKVDVDHSLQNSNFSFTLTIISKNKT